MCNLSSSEDAQFQTLIAAKDAHFPVSFQPSPIHPKFLPEIWATPHPRLDTKRGHFEDAWAAQDFPKILGKSWEIYHRLGRPHFKP